MSNETHVEDGQVYLSVNAPVDISKQADIEYEKRREIRGNPEHEFEIFTAFLNIMLDAKEKRGQERRFKRIDGSMAYMLGKVAREINRPGMDIDNIVDIEGYLKLYKRDAYK